MVEVAGVLIASWVQSVRPLYSEFPFHSFEVG